MEKDILTPNSDIKQVEINEEGNKLKCKIQPIKTFILVSIYSGEVLKYEGSISLPKIQSQIYHFTTYNINEIYEEINLDSKNFCLIKEAIEYKLKIEFIILWKKFYLYINLNDSKNLNLNHIDLIDTITELKEIIKTKDERIKSLEEELKKYTGSILTIKDDNSYDNFNIKLKEPIHKLKYHKGGIYCSTIFKDGRFIVGSRDHSLIIFNRKTFKSDLTIKEHSSDIYCVTQLNSGLLASCSEDKTIKLINIKGNEYKVIQTLTNHTNSVYKIIELNNQKLISCSADSSIKISWRLDKLFNYT